MKKTYTVGYRRKREGRTDYKKRLKLLLSGKPRLVVRVSLQDVVAQLVSFSEKGDKIVAQASAKDLKKFGWNYNARNLSSAYLVGALIAKHAKDKKIADAILDIGLKKSVPGSRVFAVLRGATENGLNVPHAEHILPSEERVQGKHIEAYAKHLQGDADLYKKRFSAYLKNGVDPLKISNVFEQTKGKITGN